jgi:hypothetical protein
MCTKQLQPPDRLDPVKHEDPKGILKGNATTGTIRRG